MKKEVSLEFLKDKENYEKKFLKINDIKDFKNKFLDKFKMLVEKKK